MFKNHTSAHLRQILSCPTLFFSPDCPHPTAQTGLNGKKCLVQNNICTQLHPKAKFKHTLTCIDIVVEWTRHQITELAPNNLILERAKSLSSKESWEKTGSNGFFLWGQCKSSGLKLYQVAIDFHNKKFRCNCQSSDNPCRHALALLFFLHKHVDDMLIEENPPNWVTDLLLQAASAPTTEEQVLRKENQEKRFGKRLEEMQSGVEELELWLLDMIQHGLSEISHQDATYWELFAAKMQDAKLGGIARRIRRMPTLLEKENWHEYLLKELSQLYLFVQSYKQFPALPELIQEEILTVAGVNRKRAELLEQEGVKDHWLVLSVILEMEDKLFSRKTYMLGSKSGQIALVLDYNYGIPKFDLNWQIGSAFSAELIFYPSPYPLRALVKKHLSSSASLDIVAKYTDIETFAYAYANAIATNPWLPSFPCLLADVYIVKKEQLLLLADSKGYSIPLLMEGRAAWSLLAVSVGQTFTVFGEWNDHYFRPMTILKDGRVISLLAYGSEIEDNIDTI